MTQERRERVTWAARITALGVIVGILTGAATSLFLFGVSWQETKEAALEGRTYARAHQMLPDSVKRIYEYFHNVTLERP